MVEIDQMLYYLSHLTLDEFQKNWFRQAQHGAETDWTWDETPNCAFWWYDNFDLGPLLHFRIMKIEMLLNAAMHRLEKPA
jgi:hypothetical protein